MKHKQTLSILIWPYRRKASDNQVMLYARLILSGKRADISLGKSIDFASWDAKRLVATGHSAEEINEYLDIVRGEIRKCYYELRSTGQEITAQVLKNKYLGVEEDKKTLMEVFAIHNNEMKGLIGKGVSEGTYKRYVVTLGKIKRFLKVKYKKSDIALSDLRYKFLAGFEHFLKTTDQLDHNTSIH